MLCSLATFCAYEQGHDPTNQNRCRLRAGAGPGGLLLAWPIPPVDRLWGYSGGPGTGARAGWAVVGHSRDLSSGYLPNSSKTSVFYQPECL